MFLFLYIYINKKYFRWSQKQNVESLLSVLGTLGDPRLTSKIHVLARKDIYFFSQEKKEKGFSYFIVTSTDLV